MPTCAGSHIGFYFELGRYKLCERVLNLTLNVTRFNCAI